MKSYSARTEAEIMVYNAYGTRQVEDATRRYNEVAENAPTYADSAGQSKIVPLCVSVHRRPESSVPEKGWQLLYATWPTVA